jgi:hypothetical protein
MKKRIAWALALFVAATIVTSRLGHWLGAPLLAPTSALVVTAVGMLLIGLAPPEGLEVEHKAMPPREGEGER